MTKTKKIKKSSGGWVSIIFVLALICYLAAIALSLYGIVVVISANMGSGSMNFGYKLDEINEFMEDLIDDDIPMSYRGVMFIMIAVALTVLGTILMVVYKKLSLKYKNRTQTVEKESWFEINDTDVPQGTPQEDSPVVAIEQPEEENKSNVKIYCAYCGEELDAKDKRCPNCGATKKIKKKDE